MSRAQLCDWADLSLETPEDALPTAVEPLRSGRGALAPPAWMGASGFRLDQLEGMHGDFETRDFSSQEATGFPVDQLEEVHQLEGEHGDFSPREASDFHVDQWEQMQ